MPSDDLGDHVITDVTGGIPGCFPRQAYLAALECSPRPLRAPFVAVHDVWGTTTKGWVQVASGAIAHLPIDIQFNHLSWAAG